MNILYGAYIAISSALFLSCAFPFWLYTRITGRYKNGLKERLGLRTRPRERSRVGSRRIWIHAASLGEVRVAKSIILSLKRISPACSVFLSTTTEHGRNLAEEILRDEAMILFAPVDFIISVRKALYHTRPDILVFLETEIWPAWIVEAHRMGIKIAMINGRISNRSKKWYLKVPSFFGYILGKVDRFSMITDRMRIIHMGADPRNIEVNGNAKYDLLKELADPSMEAEIRKTLNLKDTCPVLIAGSSRGGEESMVIKAYEVIRKEFPETVLIIAPRHIERSAEIASLLDRNNMRYQLRSEIGADHERSEQVIIINNFGELSRLYSVGTIIFCGASLVPLGGQNPLEAAAWGKAVFYGPYMDDFLDAKAILEENNAGIQVSDPEMLAEKALEFLKDPELLKEYGTRARQAVRQNQGAAERHARVIADLVR